jgi:lysophospholipid acyltransferase (LPLAT)-like uncharacterized protein
VNRTGDVSPRRSEWGGVKPAHSNGERRSRLHDATLALLGILLGVVARLWLSTLRVRVFAHPELETASGRPWVYAFWHGKQWPLLAWKRRRPTVVMVSLSRDGCIQSWALALQGLRVVRGSTSRNGARGLVALVRFMRRENADAAFAVDGPRGPRGRVKSGALAAARGAGGVVVPMTGVVRHGFVLHRAWDRFELAWPFSRVDVLLGRPVDPEGANARAELEASLSTLNGSGDASRRRSEMGGLEPTDVNACSSARLEPDGIDLDSGAAR